MYHSYSILGSFSLVHPNFFKKVLDYVHVYSNVMPVWNSRLKKKYISRSSTNLKIYKLNYFYRGKELLFALFDLEYKSKSFSHSSLWSLRALRVSQSQQQQLKLLWITMWNWLISCVIWSVSAIQAWWNLWGQWGKETIWQKIWFCWTILS